MERRGGMRRGETVQRMRMGPPREGQLDRVQRRFDVTTLPNAPVSITRRTEEVKTLDPNALRSGTAIQQLNELAHEDLGIHEEDRNVYNLVENRPIMRR